MTVNARVPAQVTKLIDDLAIDLKPAVAALEASPAATMNHYGDYMGIISRFAKDNKSMATIAVLALIQAGANREGVGAAYRIVFG